MPRAIVFIKGENWETTNNKLKELLSLGDKTLTLSYGTIMDFYVESFGNPDFIACLWSTNLELLKSSIIYLRKLCKATTTSIVGVEPDERTQVEKEMKSHAKNYKEHKDRIRQIVNIYTTCEDSKLQRLKEIVK